MDNNGARMTRHEQLFEQYVAELRDNMRAALSWWDDLLDRETAHVGSRDEAGRRREFRWPFGPPSHPFIIRVYRKYFLLCEELNRQIEAERALDISPAPPTGEEAWGNQDPPAEEEREDPIPAWVLLVDMLWGRHDDLAQFLEGLVFKPVATNPRTAEFV